LPYYDSPEQLDLLNTLYARLHLYVNFFLPVMKLEEKVRIGSRVEWVYDDPRTLMRPRSSCLSSLERWFFR
jgi:hypothetical protein